MNEHVVNFIRFATDNNEYGIANAMFEEKVVVRKGESLKARLYKVFAKDRMKFVRIMREAGFNKDADNYTTETNALAAMSKRSQEYRKGESVTEVAREDLGYDVGSKWYNDLIDTFVGGAESETTTTTTTTKPTKGELTKQIFIGLGLAGAIVGLLYLAIKRWA